MHYVLALLVVVAVGALARWMRAREVATEVIELPGPPCRARLTVAGRWTEFVAEVPAVNDADVRESVRRLDPDATLKVEAGTIRLRMGRRLEEVERPRFIALAYALVDRLTATRPRPTG